jgi:cystathionine beta-lyase
MKKDHLHLDTQLAHLGRPAESDGPGVVNTPVYHASTITFPSIAAQEAARKLRFDGMSYGRNGTPTTFALEEAIAGIEGGHRGIVFPSGVAAIAAALLACVRSGDHILMPDSVYGSARKFCANFLPRYGVEVTFYDPLIGAGVEALIRKNTRVVYVEAPGSLTFEMQDIPAIAGAAHRHDALVLMDNTWATPYFFRSFEHGVDVSIHAATKYIVGHSDAMLGLIVTTKDQYLPTREMAAILGYTAGPDDVYLALRGLRTMGVRLDRHQHNALIVASWLRARPEVAEVLYPALPGARGHDIWKRDFLGASGLFGVILKPHPSAAVEAMVDGLELFSIGASWGGFESLVTFPDPTPLRTVTRWAATGPLLRFHIGLEEPADLIADLERGFVRLKQSAAATA